MEGSVVHLVFYFLFHSKGKGRKQLWRLNNKSPIVHIESWKIASLKQCWKEGDWEISTPTSLSFLTFSSFVATYWPTYVGARKQKSLRRKQSSEGWKVNVEEIRDVQNRFSSSRLPQCWAKLADLASDACLLLSWYFVPPWPGVLVRGMYICFHHLLTLWSRANYSYMQNKHNDNIYFTGVLWRLNVISYLEE